MLQNMEITVNPIQEMDCLTAEYGADSLSRIKGTKIPLDTA